MPVTTTAGDNRKLREIAQKVGSVMIMDAAKTLDDSQTTVVNLHHHKIASNQTVKEGQFSLLQHQATSTS